jgi:hypothetical protein
MVDIFNLMEYIYLLDAFSVILHTTPIFMFIYWRCKSIYYRFKYIFFCRLFYESVIVPDSTASDGRFTDE